MVMWIELALAIIVLLYAFLGMFTAVPYLLKEQTIIKRGIIVVCVCVTIAAVISLTINYENPYEDTLSGAVQDISVNSLFIGCFSMVFLATCHRVTLWVKGKKS